MLNTAAFHARARGSFLCPGGLKETKMFLPHPPLKLSIVESLRDRETSDLQGLNFEFCVWRAVSSHSSHHPQEVILAPFSLYVHKRVLVQWLKLPAWKVGDRFDIQVSKKQVISSSLTQGSLLDQGSNLELCVRRAISTHSSQHPHSFIFTVRLA